MAKKVEGERIAKFRQDRDALEHYNDIEIAQKMGLTKSSFSSYINGRYPITNNFLKKFYTAFEEELKDIKQSSKEGSEGYVKPESPEKALEELQKKVRALESKHDKLIESHQLIAIEIRRLENKIDEIAVLLADAIIPPKKAAKKSLAKKNKKSRPQ